MAPKQSFEDLLARAQAGAFKPGALPTALGPRVDDHSSTLLPTSCFDTRWHRCPTEPVRIAFRNVAEATTFAAESSAINAAWEACRPPEEAERRADMCTSLHMTGILARACVRDEDRTVPWFGKMPEDSIRQALTAVGIRRLWEAYEVFCKTTSPLAPEATDADLESLGDLPERLAALPPSVVSRVRRLAYLIIEELN